MEWKPKKIEPKLVLANATGLAAYDEEKCKFCGRYGCTDRGYTFTTAGDLPVTIGEARWAQQMSDKLAEIFESVKSQSMNFVSHNEPHCMRKLKKSNAQAVLDKLAACGPDCHRNLSCAEGGVWKKRGEDYRCPFRTERFVCRRNEALDHSPLMCLPNKDGMVECEYHEEAYNRCFRRKDGTPCYDLKDKLGVMDEENDYLILLAHRFSAAPCRYCDEAACRNAESLHHDGVCSLKGLMAPCEHYLPLPPDKAYTDGVCTYVSSSDGKDDRKIFPNSDYAFRLSDDERITLCLACRISHSIAKATGLKCLGVRRSASNPFLNENNPLHKHAVQVNYLYLTHPEDVAKYNPELMAQAVYEALYKNCKGIGCDEMEECNFIKN